MKMKTTGLGTYGSRPPPNIRYWCEVHNSKSPKMVVLFRLVGDGVELIIKNNKEHVCFNLVMDRAQFHWHMSI